MSLMPTFHVLGELEIRRGDVRLALPPSKKTRALMAYLVLSGRAHRREQLCERFWDVTDDPRGALRWSLSKLRALVDDEHATRIVANREQVRFEPCGTCVDWLEMKRAVAADGIGALDTATLERFAEAYRGELLAGLELADFDQHEAWLAAERAEARALRLRILAELVNRHSATPERAYPHARTWASLDPEAAPAREAMARHVERLGRVEGGAGGGVAQPPPREAGAPIAGASAMQAGAAALGALVEGLARARTGGFQVVVVDGEPGIGKTHLLDAFCGALLGGGKRPLRAAALEGGGGHPYRAWLEALRVPREHLLARVEAAGGERGGRDEVCSALVAWLGEHTLGGEPVVVAIDDAQWLDEGSVELMQRLAPSAIPAYLLLAVRSGEVVENAPLSRVLRALRREGRLAEVRLGPVDLDATRRLVHALRPEASDDEVAAIHARSQGVPLFAQELARAGVGDEVPRALGALMRDRLLDLPAHAAEVLRWVALVDAAGTLEVLGALVGGELEALVEALEQLERRALVVADARGAGAYRVAHGLTRQVVLGELSEARRRLMHRRAAELFSRLSESAQADVAEVAHHALAAGDAALACDACLKVARRSLRLFANGDAFAVAERGRQIALELPEPRRSEQLIELWQVSLAARRPDDPEAVARELGVLGERALDLGAVAHARAAFHALAYLRFEGGEWGDAQRHMLQAELASRGGDERARVVGMAEAARCLVLLERDLTQAQALVLEASARARGAGVEPAALPGAIGMLELHRGRFAEARAALSRARAIAHAARERLDELQAVEYLVMVEIEREDFAAALEQTHALSELAERLRDGSEAPFARGLAALCREALGEVGAAAELEQALEALTIADAKHRLLYLLTRAALLVIDGGESRRACALAERALEIGRVLERPSEIGLARVVLAYAAELRGDGAGARAQREAVRALPWVCARVRALAEDDEAETEG